MTLLVVLILIVGSIVWLERPLAPSVCEHQGEGLLDMSFVDERGACQILSDIEAPNSLMIVNVWASWCPFCVEELPDFDTLAREFPQVPVVAINRAETVDTAQEFLSTLSLGDDVSFLFDPNDEFYKAIEGFGMPETVFLDAEGTTLFHKRGIMSLQEMRDMVELLTTRVQPNAEVHNHSLCVGDGSACGVDDDHAHSHAL